ncbi:serine protease inhibitor 77Ba-like [Galleria mellonella]|uniref:Serine protease inhibitor 77Ba-like n=1 Tax=Galleria mellonella TaxID=7137 RepID=A0A6J1WNA8_GALME|nr:serine protease inhibitor 77Ba-like [Galleria mellonella]
MTLFIYILLISTIIYKESKVLGQCTMESSSIRIKRPIYDFTINLATRIAQEKDNHFISSTLSQWTLISELSLGATDDTLEDIQKVLRLHKHRCFNENYWKIIKSLLDSGDVTIGRSSMIIIDKEFELKDAFSNSITKTGLCEISLQDFEETITSATAVNDYVNQVTQGVIDDVVTPNDFDSLNLILIDALYFKGTWSKTFATTNTDTASFYDEIGNRVGEVNLMYVNDKFNVTTIEQVNAKVLELPYGTDSGFSMLIFLPDVGTQLSSVIYNLKKISLATVFRKFEMEGPRTVTVEIPRFKITSDLDNLRELLSDMGLKTMFDSTRASFFYLSDQPLYVSDFIQKASIEVTEEGTEAAAVSEAGLRWRTLDEEFIANRPFAFIIVNSRSQLPLFIGAYSKPSVY